MLFEYKSVHPFIGQLIGPLWYVRRLYPYVIHLPPTPPPKKKHVYLYTCKDAIQCRPWASPPHPYQKTKTSFWSFGVMAITLLLINLLIDVTYFFDSCLLNAHLLRCQMSHQAFLIVCLLGPQKSQKSRKSLYFLYSFHLTDKCNRKIISPWLFFTHFTYKYVNCHLKKKLFLSSTYKNQKCLMRLFDTSKRRFQKYVTLINRFIRSRVMAETPKLKKTGFWFFDHKRVNFQ